MTGSELKAALKRLKKARARMDEAKAEYDAVQEALKAHMVAEGLEELEAYGFQLSYKTVVSSKLDVKAIKKEMPELCARYSRVSSALRFTVVLPV